MSLGLAESLQVQLALEIVIQVGLEGHVHPVQGRAGQGRRTDLIGVVKGGDQREVWVSVQGSQFAGQGSHRPVLGLLNPSAQ